MRICGQPLKPIIIKQIGKLYRNKWYVEKLINVTIKIKHTSKISEISNWVLLKNSCNNRIIESKGKNILAWGSSKLYGKRYKIDIV